MHVEDAEKQLGAAWHEHPSELVILCDDPWMQRDRRQDAHALFHDRIEERELGQLIDSGWLAFQDAELFA
jgi:hypothetical protein